MKCKEANDITAIIKHAAAPWFLYMVKTASGALYTGITLDIERRFAEHSAQSNKTAKALRGKGPLTLAYCAQLSSHSDALKAEMWIKKQVRGTKLQLLTKACALPFKHELL